MALVRLAVMAKASPSEPDGRGGRLPRAERRAQLLGMADRLFAERGYDATSMDDVASAASVSKPVLYDHFGSKDGLFAACVEQVGDQLADRIGRAAATADGPEATLRATARAYFAFAREQGNLIGVLLDAGPRGVAVIVEQVLGMRRRLADLTVTLLRRSLAAEGLSVDDRRVEATAHALVGTYEGLTAWSHEHPDTSVDVLTDWFVDLVWPGLDRVLSQAQGNGSVPA